uniref:Uncharacterized protein n=1 Tax=Arundo donax TaxID=35708 RepID=A0A0A9AX46_ARUDO
MVHPSPLVMTPQSSHHEMVHDTDFVQAVLV